MSEVTIDKVELIRRLGMIKETVEKKHNKSLTLWEQCIDEYANLMKRNMSIPSPPSKPSRPLTLDRVDGYIDMLEVINGDSIDIEIEELQSIFRNTMEAAHTVSSVYMALSDYSLSLNRGVVE